MNNKETKERNQCEKGANKAAIVFCFSFMLF